MAKVIITESLAEKVIKKFKNESVTIFSLLKTLEDNPLKGKEVGHIGNIAIKELKYKKFRFYFVLDRYSIKFLSLKELNDLIIKVVDMSEKKDQQKAINQIKHVLKNLGEEGFS